MIKFFKNLFTTKLVKREYDPYEKMHLRRLEQYEEYSLYKDKKYFTYIDNEFKSIKVLGAYKYMDVDGLISGLVVEVCSNGQILNIGFRANLFKRVPHSWVIHLTDFNLDSYITMQKYIDDDKILEDKYFKSLPKDIIRDIKIKKLIK